VSHNISEAFCGSRQQDAHEWLQCLFEALDAELEAGAKAQGLLKPISSSDQAEPADSDAVKAREEQAQRILPTRRLFHIQISRKLTCASCGT
jgi:ubiquitin C-terminal hydrolase